MAAFDSFDALLSGAEDDAFGEPLLFEPTKKLDNWGNSIGSDGRQSVTVTGVLLEGAPDILFLDGDRNGSEFSGRAVTCAAWASFDRTAFAPENFPTKNDTITSGSPVQRRFKIVDVLNDGNARIACALVRA